MREYQQSRRCLMSMLREELDDPQATECGRCSVCTGKLPDPGAVPDRAEVGAAMAHLRARVVELEPRRMWPMGSPRRGRLDAARRAEPGRALARADDAVWFADVDAALAAGGPVPGEIVDGVVALLSRWGWPAGRPGWITWVPSEHDDALLADLAGRLAGLGRMRVLNPLVSSPNGARAEARTNAEAATAALERLQVAGEVPPEAVLLLDGVTRTGFTLTVAADLLRGAGSGPVYPLVLCKQY